MGGVIPSVWHHAIMGTSPSIADCVRLTELGLMLFSGNQWNENWEWTPRLLELSEPEAERLYKELQGK